ncbi:MAG: signal peptidase I [Clostridia bacterium]|nr:signal peptidase I [Clostridia bacterium]
MVLPSTEQIKTELDRTQYRSRYSRVLRSTIYSLIVVAAIAILVATLWLPVLQIYGTSMEPTLYEGNIVLSIKGSEFETGDIIAFYYNNKILVKRVIGNPGDWIDIDAKGVIYLNNVPLDEPYVDELAIGDCNIKLPYQVPDGRVFVLGDHRATSVDSRNSAVGCVAEEQIVGRLVFRIWPITALTPL